MFGYQGKTMNRCLLVFIILCLSAGLTAGAENTTVSGDLIEISTLDAFRSYLDNQTEWYNSLYSGHSEDEGRVYADAAMPAATSAPLLAAAEKSAAGASDYSTTNVQVAGVDEADFLKNDGRYIYLIHGSSLVITDVYPPQTGHIISETPIQGSPEHLFLRGDTLVVFSSDYGVSREYAGDAYPGSDASVTHAIIYDITDRAAPRQVRDIILPGTYENGRLIGDIVYAVTREGIGYGEPFMPIVYEGSTVLARPSIWCPPVPLYSYNLATITSFSLPDPEGISAVSFLTGYDNTLYVSPDNAYFAYQKWNPFCWGWRYPVAGSPDEGEETIIHRFSLQNGTIAYEASGTVPGHLLNQFSLDESGGYLRTATTMSRYLGADWKEENNVYVLSPDLTITGRLEHLAPGEKIYAARFMGDLLYLVTFRQIDPLFVIDLSNPAQPGILGELKIPGYSDYLHPYDKTHLIGIGKDTEETESGGVISAGVKIALFDVSDLTKPRLIDSRVIGEKGSSSEVLTDHKAFLLDKSRSTMVLPIKEVFKIPVSSSTFPESYTTAVWQGAYVMKIDPLTGFIDIGSVEQDQVRPNDYSWSGSSVRRSVLMDDALYTVSDTRIIGSDINSPSDRLMMIDLPSS